MIGVVVIVALGRAEHPDHDGIDTSRLLGEEQIALNHIPQ